MYNSQGYDIKNCTTKKTFGSKWQGVLGFMSKQNLDIEEEENKVITRKKQTLRQTLLQFNDNGITLICPHIFENALYLKYSETDDNFNRELRKVAAQTYNMKKC